MRLQHCVAAFLLPMLCAAAGSADAADWQRHEVDLRAPGGQRIRAFNAPPDRRPALNREAPATRVSRRVVPPQALARPHGPVRPDSLEETAELRADPISVMIVDSPPIDGFVPYITVSATDQRTSQDETARVSAVVGPMLPGRHGDFVVGLFDTGAGTHVVGYADSVRLGITPSYLQPYETVIGGVTGSVEAWISRAIGLYMGGLRAIDAGTGSFSTAGMLGQWNVAAAVGKQPQPGQPDLPTVLGSPMSVYYAAHFRNDQMLTRTVSGTAYTAPDITFHQRFDPVLPDYLSIVPLQLRPAGAVEVQYIPCYDIFGSGCIFPPTPSIIVGVSAQSLFFLGSVNLFDRTFSALDRTQFMFDTGAQVTVISTQTASVLALNTNNPDFTAEIQGVDGQVVIKPGFYLDGVALPALNEWLQYTNVPVVVLDVASPEGGVLQGIIGMNLFTNYNFVLRGGGLQGQGAQPTLECQVIVPLAVDADFDGDGDVDQDDFGHFQACFTGAGKVQKTLACLNARLDADSDVDMGDFEVFANCVSGPNVQASPDCAP